MQVTDISTFTDDKKRAEVDAWLYETCTQCLQHIIDITVKFYPVVQPLLGRVLELLLNFIRSAAKRVESLVTTCQCLPWCSLHVQTHTPCKAAMTSCSPAACTLAQLPPAAHAQFLKTLPATRIYRATFHTGLVKAYACQQYKLLKAVALL